jgi:predicted aldo/keto reductase-like oxidoreductase
LGDKHGEIDEPQATEMIHYAIDHSVTYLGTAYSDHEGNSERFLGRALQQGYRDRANWRPSCPAG